MIKSYIFASMYTVVGMTGWGAYTTISTEDTSVLAIQKIAATAIGSQQNPALSKSLYRWRDHEGNWQYGEMPTSEVNMASYEKELAVLRSLPREVLPTQALKQAEKSTTEGLLAMIPSLDELAKFMKFMNKSESQQNTPQVNKLIDETEKLKQLMQQRQELLGNISK